MAPTVILITGANSGIGYATAKVIATASEAFHVIMSSRSLEKVESAKKEIEGTGISGTLSALQLDVTDNKSIENAVEHVSQKFGRLDVLINNAGAAGVGTTNVESRLRLCLEINVIGPAKVSEAFQPLLLKSKNPYSIYLSSVMGSLALASDPTSIFYKGPRNGEAYRASKSALNMVILQEIVANTSPLKIFAVCPGFVRSYLRGTSEEAVSGRGNAGDPAVSGETILRIIQGERDVDEAKFVHKDGVYPW